MGVGGGGGGAYKLLGSMLSTSRGVFMSRRSVGYSLFLGGIKMRNNLTRALYASFASGQPLGDPLSGKRVCGLDGFLLDSY